VCRACWSAHVRGSVQLHTRASNCMLTAGVDAGLGGRPPFPSGSLRTRRRATPALAGSVAARRSRLSGRRPPGRRARLRGRRHGRVCRAHSGWLPQPGRRSRPPRSPACGGSVQLHMRASNCTLPPAAPRRRVRRHGPRSGPRTWPIGGWPCRGGVRIVAAMPPADPRRPPVADGRSSCARSGRPEAGPLAFRRAIGRRRAMAYPPAPGRRWETRGPESGACNCTAGRPIARCRAAGGMGRRPPGGSGVSGSGRPSRTGRDRRTGRRGPCGRDRGCGSSSSRRGHRGRTCPSCRSRGPGG